MVGLEVVIGVVGAEGVGEGIGGPANLSFVMEKDPEPLKGCLTEVTVVVDG